MSDLTAQQQNALTDLFGALCPNIALALSEQINRVVELDTPVVEIVPLQSLLARSDRTLYSVFSLSQPLTVESLFYVSAQIASLFADLMDGNDGSAPPETLTDAQSTRLSDAMAGLVRGLATAMTNRSGEAVDMESSVTTLAPLSLPPIFAAESEAVQITLNLDVPELQTGTLIFLFTPEFAQALVAESDKDEPTPASASTDDILSEEELAGMLGSLGLSSDMPGLPEPTFGLPPANEAMAPPFANFPTQDASMPRGLDLILDIPLDVTVELGRIQMLIRDVLELSSGSIVELDRVAGEPVDLLVNGRLIAKGEVVVIEDNFGIRITEIISPADRVAGLGKR
jgi:flagellar motor switch protein FliN